MPKALIAMFENRKSVTGGRIEWARSTSDRPADIRSYVSRYANNGDTIFEDRGDAEGWTGRDENGNGVHRYPQLYLANREGYWKAQETGLTGTWWSTATTPLAWSEVKDVRGVGLACSDATMRQPPGKFDVAALVQGVRLLRWSESDEGDLRIVRAEYEGDTFQTWYLNPKKDWQAERVTLEMDEQVLAECKVELANYGGVWLPAVAEYYSKDRLLGRITLTNVEIDKEHGQASFGPADIDIECGMDVFRQDSSAEVGAKWNGEKLVSVREWFDDVKVGRREPGPRMKKLASGGYDSPYQTDEQRDRRAMLIRQAQMQMQTRAHDSVWARYVRTFCEKYGLDQEQRQKATLILHQCQQNADEYTKSKQDAFNAAIERLNQAESTRDNGKLDEARAELERLRSPINDIFEKQLKPRLDRLPTREQRKKAEASPTSQPATP